LSDENGSDDNGTIDFESLEQEGDSDESSQKMTEYLKFLEENLTPEKYTEACALLGVKKEMSNAELFEAIKGLMKKPEEEEEEDPDDPEAKKKKAAKDGDGEEKVDRAAFMKECMAGGKTLEECTDEFKKKYPEPAKDEGEGDDDTKLELPEDIKKQLKEMADKITALEGDKQLGEVATQVDELVKEKHLAPVQRDTIIKLAAGMNPDEREELLGFFKSTQKISVHQDAGRLASEIPGAGGNVLDSARKKELVKLHGLDDLIMDKADRSKLPWEENN